MLPHLVTLSEWRYRCRSYIMVLIKSHGCYGHTFIRIVVTMTVRPINVLVATLQREVSTSSTWDGGSVEPLIHSQHGAIVTVVETLIKSHLIFIRT